MAEEERARRLRTYAALNTLYRAASRSVSNCEEINAARATVERALAKAEAPHGPPHATAKVGE